jgi:hypothetical protein
MLLERPTPPLDRDPLRTRAGLHAGALFTEYTAVWARGALQCARNFLSVEVTPIRGEAPPGRFTVLELLARHPRLLVIGGEGAGQSALVAQLALHPLLHEGQGGAGHVIPFVVTGELLRPDERLTVSTLARVSPAAGAPLLEHALAAGRALIIVEGLERAPGGPAALLESIPAFAQAHAENRFVVITQPLPARLPGARRTELPGFLTTAMLPPLPPSRVLPAYRFVGLRSPERKAALYLEHVEVLLRAWAPEALPPGSTMTRITPRDLRKLMTMIAAHMHRGHDYEIEVGSLTKEIGNLLWVSKRSARVRVEIPVEEGPPRGTRSAAELAPSVVDEISAHPGLLIERRPGRFVFADFVLQEVLAAVEMARLDGVGSFVEHRHDPWWHGVIELSAGLPQVDPAKLVGALLDADWGDAADVSVLAARCAEAAPTLPERTRRTVARRFGSLTPPEHLIAAERLVEIGDIAASAVLAGIRRGDATQRALSALVLGQMHHEPACGALIALSSDTAVVDGTVAWPVGGAELELSDTPVATSAISALLALAQVSRMGRKAFARGLTRAPRASVQRLYDHLERKRLDVYMGEVDPDRDAGLMESLQDLVHESLRRWERGDRLRPR